MCVVSAGDVAAVHPGAGSQRRGHARRHLVCQQQGPCVRPDVGEYVPHTQYVDLGIMLQLHGVALCSQVDISTVRGPGVPRIPTWAASDADTLVGILFVSNKVRPTVLVSHPVNDEHIVCQQQGPTHRVCASRCRRPAMRTRSSASCLSATRSVCPFRFWRICATHPACRLRNHAPTSWGGIIQSG